MDRPAVTVCMPASRDGADLRAALASVLVQTYDDLEVVVSDDSGGGLRAAVEAAADRRIRYFANQERLGFARNHTTTLDRSRGRYLAFLHDDDRWSPDYLARTVEVLDADPELGMVCTDVWLEHAGGRRERRPHRPRPGRHDRWLETVMRHPQFQPSSTVLRREVWEHGRRAWPEVGIGDLVLWIDAARAGWPMFWLDEPLATYRQHPGQIIASPEVRRASVVVLSGYVFDEDPAAETVRRRRLARAHVGCAGAALKEGRGAEARADLAHARRLCPQELRAKRIALDVLTRQRWALPLAETAWRRMRLRGRAA